jgi:hypothetical protein
MRSSEYPHIFSVLPICDEFCESADFAGNQEKIGKRMAQGLGNDQFGAECRGEWFAARIRNEAPTSLGVPVHGCVGSGELLGSSDSQFVNHTRRAA